MALAENAGRVLSRDALMDLVKGEPLEAFDRSIDVHVSRIRAAIEDDPKKPRRILTVRGAGYVFAKQQALMRRLYLRIYLAVVGEPGGVRAGRRLAWRTLGEPGGSDDTRARGVRAQRPAAGRRARAPSSRRRSSALARDSARRPRAVRAGRRAARRGAAGRSTAPRARRLPARHGGPPVWAMQLRRRPLARGARRRTPRAGASASLVLALILVAVGVGAYPVVRRLTRRLERLQRGVDALGEGDLSARVEVEGRDEVARLAEGFNRAAARIEQLVGAHKQLLANASHELRTPLARIRMAVELMKERADPQRSASSSTTSPSSTR